MSDSQVRSVLFVCLGNICRSPTGEGVLQHLVDSRNLTGRILIDSAGTADYHTGYQADPRMRGAAQRRGYDLTSRSRQITRIDLEVFDLVVAMDSDNYQDILTLHSAPTATIRLLSHFLSDEWPQDVPDPYFDGNREGFENVMDMIEAACPAILDELLANES